MAKRRVSASAQRGLRSSSSHRIRKQTTSRRKANPREVRRSARLEALLQPKGRNRGKEAEAGLSSRAGTSQDQAQASTSNNSPLKRKRGQEVPYSSKDPLPSKRSRTSTRHTTEGPPQETEKHTSTTVTNPIQVWVLNKRWPGEYSEPDDQASAETLERSWQEDMAALPPIPDVQYIERNGFKYPLPVKKAPTSLRRKQSDSSLAGSSDQNNRESKSTPYRDLRYATLLAAKGSHMNKSDLGITNTSLSSCKTLLSSEQTIPTNSLFRDDVFEATCRGVQDRNESRIVRSISPYIVPSAEDLAIMGAAKLKCLIENVNEGWTGSIPVQGPRPQPDYSVGFRRSAFSEEQLKRLDPLIGSVFDTSFFVATYRMYFPFLACEVKCGAAALDVADRQNAHSMTIAVRSIIELYRAVKREKELDREILAFSISHDDTTVRIYGHYAVVNASETTFYRHPIKKFDFTSEEGADKWTAYRFIKNVYDVWMPTHLDRIYSAIDQLPSSLNFQVSEGSEVQSEAATGLSQDMGSLLSDQDNVDDELSPIPQAATPDTSVSKGLCQGPAKRAKKPRITTDQTGRRKERPSTGS